MIPLYFFVPVMQYLNHLEQILLANNCYIYFGEGDINYPNVALFVYNIQNMLYHLSHQHIFFMELIQKGVHMKSYNFNGMHDHNKKKALRIFKIESPL